jgi:hypothetical protein
MSSIPQPFYNPQISPTSTFVAPQVIAPTPVQVQLGQGLEDIGPAFMNFSTTLASFVGRQVAVQNEENVKAGQAKVMASRKTFKQLVDTGKLDPAANPWEAYGAAQADAVMAARDFTSKLRFDYEANAAKDPMFMDSVGSFDNFANERIRQAASGGVQNPVWVNTFLEEIDRDVTEMSKGHVVEVGRMRRKKMAEGLTVGMAADIGSLMRNVDSLPILGAKNDKFIADTAKQLQTRIDNVAQTIGGESANEVAVEAIIALRLEYGDDPRIRSVAEKIKTPGGPLVKTERYRAAEAARDTDIDRARGRMTIEKRAQFKDYLGQYFTTDRLRTMKGTDILEGKGFPAWEEIEGDVRRMGVSADLYEDMRGNYETMKATIIREKAADVVHGMASEIGTNLGMKFAEAAQIQDNNTRIATIVRLAEASDLQSVVAEGENQIRLLSRAYGLKDGDAPKSINIDDVRRAAIETAYSNIPRDPNTGIPTQEGIGSMIQVARALNAKYLHTVTPMMRSAVAAWNQPNADVTQIPAEVMTAINIYEVAASSNETEMLGLPEGEKQFLEVVSTLIRSGTSRIDAVRRANQLTSGSGKAFKMQEPKREEIMAAVKEWNDEGSWTGNAVADDATGIGTVEQTIRDLAYANQLGGMGMAESLGQAKRYVTDNAIVFEGTVIMAPRTNKVLGKNVEAWGAARDTAVERINARIAELNKRGLVLPSIDPMKVTFAPRSSSRDNVNFDLIYKNGGNSVDLPYGVDDFREKVKFSFTVDELSEMVTKESKARYGSPRYSPEFLNNPNAAENERRRKSEIERYNRENP